MNDPRLVQLVWQLEDNSIRIHDADPDWGYVLVRVPITLAQLVARLAEFER